MSKRKKKDPSERVFKDRFLGVEKDDNIYLTFLLYFAVFFMSFLLIFVSFVSLCYVDGMSMENTLQDKEHVLLFKTYQSIDPGDVVTIMVYDPVKKKDEELIKRVVGVSGDTLLFKTDPVHPDYVDLYRKPAGSDSFERVEENYIKERMLKIKFTDPNCKFKPDTEILVPDDFVFFMGDNRNDSSDARFFGMQPEKQILGKMFFRLDKGSLLEKMLMWLFSATR